MNLTGDECILDLMDEDGRTTGIYTKKGKCLGSECLAVGFCYFSVYMVYNVTLPCCRL